MTTYCKGKVVVRAFQDTPAEASALGPAKRLVTARDSPPVSLSLFQVTQARAHYHEATVEIYVCTGGRGRLEVDGEVVPLTPGTVVTVKPGVVHKPVSEEALEVLIINCPPPGDPPDRIYTE